MPGWSMAADDYVRWRIRLECQRVGCSTPTTVCWSMWDEHIQHGAERYDVAQGPYESAWQGIAGWLDQLHAPLLEAKHREEEHRKLNDQFPLRTVDPLIGG